VDPPPGSRVTFAFLSPFAPQELDAVLQRVYPGLGPPETVREGPSGAFTILGYEVDDPALVTRRGLWADYFTDEGGRPAISRVDPAQDFSWEQSGVSVEPPFTVRWRGVVRTEEGGRLSLRALTEDAVEVRVDGQLVDAGAGPAHDVSFIDLRPGWHPVEIVLKRATSASETVRLEWERPDGSRSPVAAEDLFPLATLDGWLHSRALPLEGGGAIESQRLDFTVHYSSAPAVEALAGEQRLGGPIVDRWESVWRTEGGTYNLALEARGGTATLYVDGEAVLTVRGGAPPVTAEASLAVDAGAHELRIEHVQRGGAWLGARLTIADPEDPAFRPDVRPY
jgi:hypothetical protein